MRVKYIPHGRLFSCILALALTLNACGPAPAPIPTLPPQGPTPEIQPTFTPFGKPRATSSTPGAIQTVEAAIFEFGECPTSLTPAISQELTIDSAGKLTPVNLLAPAGSDTAPIRVILCAHNESNDPHEIHLQASPAVEAILAVQPSTLNGLILEFHGPATVQIQCDPGQSGDTACTGGGTIKAEGAPPANATPLPTPPPTPTPDPNSFLGMGSCPDFPLDFSGPGDVLDASIEPDRQLTPLSVNIPEGTVQIPSLLAICVTSNAPEGHEVHFALSPAFHVVLDIPPNDLAGMLLAFHSQGEVAMACDLGRQGADKCSGEGAIVAKGPAPTATATPGPSPIPTRAATVTAESTP